jgi:hypothetical protein
MIGRTLGHFQILDFGLAKAQDPGGGSSDPARPPDLKVRPPRIFPR